jgi:sugar phosphate isomerase/epimerase
MKKLAVGTWAFVLGPYQANPLSLHSVLHGAEEAGFQGIELGTFAPYPNPVSHNNPQRRQQLRREVTDHGLGFAALLADLRSHKLVSVEDGGPFVAAFERNLQFAVDLGIDTVGITTAEAAAEDPRLMFDRAAKAFGECARLAAERGVRVAWEFDPGLAINRPEEIVALVEAVRADHPNFGALFDTCNAHLCAGDALELLRPLKGKITHVHIADCDGTGRHVPPGRGQLNFDRLVPELLGAGVPGEWWCLDLEGWPDAWDALTDSRKFLHSLLRKYAAQA